MSSVTRETRVWPLIAVRVVILLLAAMALAQAVLAGSYLNGRIGALSVHLSIGMAMVAVALILTVFSGIAVAQGATRRMLVSAAALTVVLALQVFVRMAGLVGLHVPLGVLLVTGIAMQTLQAFRRPVAPVEPVPARVARS